MLPAERARASFDVNIIIKLVGADKAVIAQQFKEELFSGPPFNTELADPFRSYEDLHLAKLERVKAAHCIMSPNVLV